MNKLIFCLLLAITNFCFCKEPEISDIYQYCKLKRDEAEVNINECEKMFLLPIYRTEANTYNDVMEYIAR